MPRTKIVILNWNGEEHLRRFLPSVVQSIEGVAGVSVVVADNGSKDGSLALLGSDFPTVELVTLDRNYGFAEGYNRALKGLRRSITSCSIPMSKPRVAGSSRSSNAWRSIPTWRLVRRNCVVS